MAFAEPISIKDAIESVHRKKYLLPAIQREFVWDTDRIEMLFDSLMRDYPINSFLFWDLDKENIASYQFYEFVRNYHERDSRHNPKANINGENGITAILDGQQRLTSLYIGLKGSYAYRLSRKRWDNNAAFPKRNLCLNLLLPSENTDLEYDFKFLTAEEIERKDDSYFWFVVGNILEFESLGDVNNFLIENLFDYGKEKVKFANNTLCKLFQIIHLNKSINFFLEKSKSLDKVLNIFIRVNSGGTQLSYSDLLLSIATAQWKEKDAREEITAFVDEINSIGNGFNIDKDFVLKNCLVLSDFKDIAFRVDNFNQQNMKIIEKSWDNISDAIKSSYILLSSFGYNRDTLTSNYVIILIAYYLMKIGNPDSFAIASKYEKDRKNIFKWLIVALLKRTFGGQPDNILRPLREIIKQATDEFPYLKLVERQKGTSKTLTFDYDEMTNLFYYQYGQSYTYSILACMYPTLDFRNKFHQDHVFPKSLFTEKKLKKAGIPDEDIDFYLENYNCIANLQLLEGIPNQEKSKKLYSEWIIEKYPDLSERKFYMKKHYIPDCSLEITNFKEFITKRKELMVNGFKQIIGLVM